MATIAGITVDYFLSPRVIRIPIPLIEITIQDMHDTLRDIEDEPSNMVYPDLISTAGKEALGGGVTVGLTATLQNAIVAFEARKTSVSSGTVTTGDATGRILIDSAATFVTDLVETGAWIVNSADEAVASVVTIDSETQITCDFLGNGSDNQWDISDNYKIWNVIQCSITGGNLVAINDVDAAISPILPTMGTQVKITGSSSATLQELLDIQHSSFNGGVTVDVTSIYSGVTYPIGTPRQPVNNIVDALSIAATNGFIQLYIKGNITFDTGDTIDSFKIIGNGTGQTVININPGAVISSCELREAFISGTFDGNNTIIDSHVEDILYVDGHIQDTIVTGTITLSGTGLLHMTNCTSGVPGVSTPTLDFGGSGSGLSLRNYAGGLLLTNKTGTDDCSIDLNSGQLRIDTTVTGGTIIVRGVGKVVDDSTGLCLESGVLNTTATLVNEVLSGVKQDIIEALLRNKTITDPGTGVMTIYATDGITPLYTANIFEDAAGVTPYSATAEGIERRERFD